MKKPKKNIKINIEPFNSSIRRYEGGFTWTFTSTMSGGFRRKIVNIKFSRWWLVYLAAELRKVIEEEQNELNRIIELTEFKI